MRVLIACEFSGIVRDAFAARGHDAWSCDLLPSETKGNHLQGDVLEWLDDSWDAMIAHPPCTRITNAGVRWLYIGGSGPGPMIKDPVQWAAMEKASIFFRTVLESKIPKTAIENPIPHGYALEIIGRKYNQIIQPWQFGHGETKATCLWLKGLPMLKPTNIVEGRRPRVHFASPGPDRWKERSRTLTGIAQAMADQWGNLQVD